MHWKCIRAKILIFTRFKCEARLTACLVLQRVSNQKKKIQIEKQVLHLQHKQNMNIHSHSTIIAGAPENMRNNNKTKFITQKPHWSRNSLEFNRILQNRVSNLNQRAVYALRLHLALCTVSVSVSAIRQYYRMRNTNNLQYFSFLFESDEFVFYSNLMIHFVDSGAMDKHEKWSYFPYIFCAALDIFIQLVSTFDTIDKAKSFSNPPIKNFYLTVNLHLYTNEENIYY